MLLIFIFFFSQKKPMNLGSLMTMAWKESLGHTNVPYDGDLRVCLLIVEVSQGYRNINLYKYICIIYNTCMEIVSRNNV